MTELQRFSPEAEEVLKELETKFDGTNYVKYKDKEFDYIVSIKECAFNLLQWLLDRGAVIHKEHPNIEKFMYYEIINDMSRGTNKDLIQAVDQAIKAIKERE